MDMPNQLTSHVQIRNLTYTAGASNSIDAFGFGNVLFCVGFAAAGNVSVTLQSSPDGTTWTPVTPGYYESASAPYPAAGGTIVETVAGAVAANQFVFLSLNRPQPGMRYFRVNVTTGTPTTGVALLGNPRLSAPAQPDLAIAEFKGTF